MVLRKEFQSSGAAVNSTGTVAELDHGCSRCLDAGAGRDETLVQLVSDNGCYQQFGSSTFPLSQPLQKYLLAKAKQVLGSSSSSSSGCPCQAPGRGCLGRRNQHYLLGQSSPELAGPLGCSSTVQVPGLAKPFPSAQKVTFLVYSTDSCP